MRTIILSVLAISLLLTAQIKGQETPKIGLYTEPFDQFVTEASVTIDEPVRSIRIDVYVQLVEPAYHGFTARIDFSNCPFLHTGNFTAGLCSQHRVGVPETGVIIWCDACETSSSADGSLWRVFGSFYVLVDGFTYATISLAPHPEYGLTLWACDSNWTPQYLEVLNGFVINPDSEETAIMARSWGAIKSMYR